MPKEVLLGHDDIDLITRTDLAKILKKGISSIDLIPENELPRVHLGKSIRYRRKRVLEYIESKEKSNG